MSGLFDSQTVTATSPSTSTAAAASGQFRNLARYRTITVDALVQGATGDVLDIYLQRLVGATWVDWLHLPQLAAAAAAVRYTIDENMLEGSVDPVTVGAGSSPALAAGALACAHPGNEVRIWFEPGALTSAGASQTIVISGHTWR